MAGLSLYLKDVAAGAFRALQVAGSVPTTATTGTGWTVGTTAPTAYSQMASAANLLSNPGAETDLTGYGSNAATVARSALAAYKGSYGIILTTTNVTDSHVRYEKDSNTGLTPAVVYTASVMARLAAPSATAKSFTLLINFYNAGAFVNQVTQAVSLSSTNWTEFRVTGTAGAAVDRAYVILGTNGAQGIFDIYTDDWKFAGQGTERAAATFGATAQPPDSGPDAALGDGFRTENLVNGRFVGGVWTIPVPVIRVTAGTTTDGNVLVRLWRSPNPDGSAATEITRGAVSGTTVTNLTNAEQISTATVTLPEFGVVDEFLFLSLAWQISGAGGGATDDCLVRVGASGTITTPDFTVATATEYWAVLAGQGLAVKKGDYVRQMAQQFAAQLSTNATTGVRLGELTKVQPSWSGGSGFPNFDADNPTRYFQGYGVDVTGTKDKAQVGPALTASRSSANNAARVFGQYNSQLYVGYSTGQVDRQTATDTWSAAVGTITSSKPVSAIAEAAKSVDGVTTRMWVANGSDGLLASWNGAAFTNSDADTNIGPGALARVTWLGSWSPPEPSFSATSSFIIGGKLSGSNAAIVGVASPTAFSGGTEWRYQAAYSNTADVGYPDVTAALAGSDGQFYWCASDTSAVKAQVIKSTWALNAGTNRQFFGDSVNLGYLTDDYITAFAEISGVVYALGAVGRIYKVVSDKLVQIASAIQPVSSETLYGMTVWSGALMISCRVGSSLLVRRYGPADPNDSAAEFIWSDPIYGGAIDASATAARQITSFGGYLYAATEAAGASKVYRMDDAVYSTSAVTLQTGEIVFDSATIVKSIKIEHSALVSGDSIQLKYARNGQATYANLGTNSTVGSTSTSYPVAASGQVTRLSVQFVATSGSSATTPQLGQLTVVVRPVGDVTREWTITTEAWGTATMPGLKRKDGSTEPRTGQAITDSLWAIFEEGVPQRYRDLDGTIWTVTVEDWQDSPQEELAHPDGWRWTGTVKLREV